jgi:predicted ATPase/DNA-binding XRE family transcriptional regulator
MDESQPFGQVLKRLRRSAGLTHEALAERAGLGARTISDLERGVSRAPRADTLALLVEALELTTGQRALLEASARQSRLSWNVAPDAPRPHLPLQLTSFIGREREIRTVQDLLGRDEIRLVTLTGPGGVGKTRLALQIGSQLAERFPGGVVLVDLAPLADPADVCLAIGLALGIDASTAATLGSVANAIGRKALLLLLDNFEHLLDAAPVVSEIARACPGLNVLATSRAALRISGEQEFPVQPLPVPDAVDLPDIGAMAEYASIALFVDRASRVQPDFALTAENAAAIATICARLDGLPLALELAAARMRTFSLRELLRQLETSTDAPSLRLLDSGPRDAPARQRTLRDTIGWSHGLLPEHEQILFRRLAVFVGGCTRSQARAVCGPPRGLDERDWPVETIAPLSLDEVDRGLVSLIDQNLIYLSEEANSEQRVQMLETIGEFAQERLAASGEEAELRRRHARFFLALVESTGALLFAPASKRQVSATEQGNLSAALSWLVEQG